MIEYSRRILILKRSDKMPKRKFIRKSTRKRRNTIILVIVSILLLGIGYSSVNANLGVGGLLTILKSKVMVITLDNDNATTSGTTTIYQKYSYGYYLDSSNQNEMTATTNYITIPLKTGFVFNGYYTEQNGAGDQYIDDDGIITTSAVNTHFTRNGFLYASWSVETPTPQLTICNTTDNNNLQDVFSYHVTSSSYETWIELNKGECETVSLTNGQYQITEIDKIGYTISSINGLTENGGTLHIKRNKEYVVTFNNSYSANGYFFNYGNTKAVLGG